jgi:hypothetical protein
MSTTPQATAAKSPLDAAQKIVAELQGMTADHQSLALKFAMETLGLQSPPAYPQPLHAPPPASRNLATPQTHSLGGHSTDIRSFTLLKEPKTDTQFAAVVAYFYQFEAPPDQRKDVIDRETMKHSARLANRKQPPDWRFTLQNARNAGYLESAGDGNYRLSPVGENLVAITLPGNATASVGKKKKSKRKTARKLVAKKAKRSE